MYIQFLIPHLKMNLKIHIVMEKLTVELNLVHLLSCHEDLEHNIIV